MRVADREVLYYLLKKEPVTQEVREIEKPLSSINSAQNSENQQTVIETARNSEELISEIEREYLQEEVEEDPEDQRIIISDDLTDEDSDTSVILIVDDTGTIEEKITYMDPGFAIPEPSDLLELETDEKAESEPEKTRDPVSPKQLQNELIDKFIIANPRIEPRKEKSDAPVIDISKPFVEERGEFVSETLARIYLNQGYYSRAIDIYEKLSLKFPEKSSYFATQIEKVKELLKK